MSEFLNVAHIAVAVTFVGLVVSAIGIALLSWIALLWGETAWRRLRRCYHLTVLAYWLDRLERHGVREFRKAEAEDLAQLRRHWLQQQGRR